MASPTMILYSTFSPSSGASGELAVAQTLSFLRSQKEHDGLSLIVLSSSGLDLEEEDVQLVLVQEKGEAAWLRTWAQEEQHAVVVCVGGGEGDQAVMEVCAELGVHHISSARNPRTLKATLFRLSYLASKPPRRALILPMCDALTVALDLTATLHPRHPPPGSTLLASFVAPPSSLSSIVAAARESAFVRRVWGGDPGVLYETGVFFQCNWELEDRVPGVGGSLTSPYHELTNIFSQRARGEHYAYLEEWNASVWASLLVGLALAVNWIASWMYAYGSRLTSLAPTPLPLPTPLSLTTTLFTKTPKTQTHRLTIPASPTAQDIVLTTSLALHLLFTSQNSLPQDAPTGVLTVSAALGAKGCEALRERLGRPGGGGWVWS